MPVLERAPTARPALGECRRFVYVCLPHDIQPLCFCSLWGVMQGSARGDPPVHHTALVVVCRSWFGGFHLQAQLLHRLRR